MKHILLILFLLPFSLHANQRAQGYCQQGGQVVVTSGLNSTTKVQQSYPSCTVTVYLTGTLTLATLYSDNSSTPQANPFTASSVGLWFWYAVNGRYDVKMSGGGIASPFTIADILLADPTGSSPAVTSVTAGAGIAVTGPTITPTVSNTWGAVPSGSQLQYLRIQPNTGNNTTFQFSPTTTYRSTDYNFPSQAPGGSLSIGSNQFTMTPCPLGVSGADVAHYLYFSGGTGTAEAGLITGGTCTSGATTGTVIATVAGTHSGAWTVTSATTGAQEAVNVTPNPGTAVIPASANATVYAPIAINRDNLTLTTEGYLAGTITLGAANIDAIQVGDGVHKINGVAISGLVIVGPASTSSSGYGINVRYAGVVRISNVRIYGASKMWRAVNFYKCISCDLFDSLLELTVDRVVSISGSGAGADSSTDVKMFRNTFDSFGTDAVWIGDFSDGLFFQDNEVFSGASTVGWAVNAGGTTVPGRCCLFIQNNEIESLGDLGGINLVNFTGGRVKITGNSIAGNVAGLTGKAGLIIGDGVIDVIVDDNLFQSAVTAFYAIYSTGSAVITGNLFRGGGVTQTLVRLHDGSSGYTVTGNKFYDAVSYGLTADQATVSMTAVGNTFSNTSAVINWAGDPAHTVISGNVGCNDQIPTIASGASIALPGCGDQFVITGTTALATMTGGWNGRVVRLQFTNATPGGTTTGGTPAYAFAFASAVVQNHVLTCTYFGSNWACQ